MKRIVIYNDEIHSPPGLVVGERVELIRGNGRREGQSMGFATITIYGSDELLDALAEGTQPQLDEDDDEDEDE